MITNYILENIENEDFKLIKISNDSIIFKSSYNIYFKELNINKISAKKFFIKDFTKNNLYNKIIIDNSIKEIEKDEFIIVMETYMILLLKITFFFDDIESKLLLNEIK